MNTESVTGDKTGIKRLADLTAFKQINTFTLVYRNELHNLFTDNVGHVS